ncbi:MAG: hypothetical protein ACKO96_00945 [Flammeovirgaceae bacterium]
METAKLRLKTKKLASGKFQINFATEGAIENYYGYLLAEPLTPLQEVIAKIHRHVDGMNDRPKYFQRNLYSLQMKQVNSGRILIFKK